MKIFVIGSVRDATDEVRKKFEDHVKNLEQKGYKVCLINS